MTTKFGPLFKGGVAALTEYCEHLDRKVPTLVVRLKLNFLTTSK
ncbi:hypothetical protein [Psychromonas sp. MB-3u-54]|nr:hypothetical protein [Psychromonas sp. MB-3u-54]